MTQIMREETRFCHCMGYSFQLTATNVLHVPSHRQNSTYHDPCYTMCLNKLIPYLIGVKGLKYLTVKGLI